MGVSYLYLFFVFLAAYPGKESKVDGYRLVEYVPGSMYLHHTKTSGYPSPLAQGSTGDAEMSEFSLDTDYRDYNTSADHTGDEVVRETQNIAEIIDPKTEILCVRTTIKQGANIPLTINNVMTRNGTILKSPTVSSAANPINNSDGCHEIITTVWDDYNCADLCKDLALVWFPLCLLLMLALKVYYRLRAVKDVCVDYRTRAMCSRCHGYITVPRTPPPSCQECLSGTRKRTECTSAV